ncbi:Spx/MgsR family RNA polymerase-binding regulatory protein [Sulfurimonas aquatica]|uniref:Spx/MgsR family RNA polymerase-binding regulatory protein n=1 Tax=Sulfurimonas aquatica TaxID=2672570 RepID=A0A975GCR4_9BACT|nr:Spx/MgsR family RNA polymerase-binding regulatory protein [Sulfurimonas aquatica]QSZ41588.1 Spx/MgsR family RNA polymerase-binding regulatory protein [Sulfurimonas aquatica]
MIKVYGIKNCDSVKKALSFFKKNNLEYELFDFKSEPLPCEKISEWLEKTDMKTLFNSRSTTYRNLKLKEMNLNEDEQKGWLCKENLLIKRPVVEFNGSLLVGYKDDIYQRSFL